MFDDANIYNAQIQVHTAPLNPFDPCESLYRWAPYQSVLGAYIAAPHIQLPVYLNPGTYYIVGK